MGIPPLQVVLGCYTHGHIYPESASRWQDATRFNRIAVLFTGRRVRERPQCLRAAPLHRFAFPFSPLHFRVAMHAAHAALSVPRRATVCTCFSSLGSMRAVPIHAFGLRVNELKAGAAALLQDPGQHGST
jgi:hypothetical protein